MASGKSKVHFLSNDVNPKLRNIKRLKLFIEAIFKKEEKELELLNYVFCSDKTLLGINQKYLNHDFYTDVITFDLSTNKEIIVGEVYLSIDRIKENAQNLNETFLRELHRVIFHGALHLCGYDDKTDRQIKKIRSLENELLEAYSNGKLFHGKHVSRGNKF